MHFRIWWTGFWLAFIASLGLAACQATISTSTATPFNPAAAGTITISVTRAPTEVIAARAASLPGKFVYARPQGNLVIQDARGANVRNLVPTNGDTLAQFPSFSPDGMQVVYAFNYFNQQGLIVQDIRVVDADGTNARAIITPDHPKTTFDLPVWTPDGKSILFTQAYSTGPASEHSEIDRVAVTGGAPTKILDDGRIAAISPDGAKIAFRRLDLKTFGSSLWVANSDGGEAKQLVGIDAFVDISAARFTPDSQGIVFAGSGEPKKKLPGLAYRAPHTDDCYFALWFFCAVERADAHGLPSDLYYVDLAATKFERLTRAGADSPFPAWSPDGRYLGFLSEIGIFAVDRQTKELFQVTSQGGYGGFDWK